MSWLLCHHCFNPRPFTLEVAPIGGMLECSRFPSVVVTMSCVKGERFLWAGVVKGGARTVAASSAMAPGQGLVAGDGDAFGQVAVRVLVRAPFPRAVGVGGETRSARGGGAPGAGCTGHFALWYEVRGACSVVCVSPLAWKDRYVMTVDVAAGVGGRGCGTGGCVRRGCWAVCSSGSIRTGPVITGTDGLLPASLEEWPLERGLAAGLTGHLGLWEGRVGSVGASQHGETGAAKDR